MGPAAATQDRAAASSTSTARWTLVGFHNFLLVINLVPMYPLDGGRILQAALWAYFSRRGAGGSYGRASLVTVYVSRVCVVLWVLVAIVVYGSIMMGFIGVWSWLEAENLYRRIREGAGEDFTFGYDFSRGYTSLEGGSTTSRKAMKPCAAKNARAAAEPASSTAKLRAKRQSSSSSGTSIHGGTLSLRELSLCRPWGPRSSLRRFFHLWAV